MTIRTASCRCGQLKATVTGDPVRVSVCHCLDCKKRSGSAFAAQARWPADQVTIAGESKAHIHIAESGNKASFHFCPACGSDLYYIAEAMADLIAIPLGIFDEPFFPTPNYSVFEGRKPNWLAITGADVEHFD